MQSHLLIRSIKVQIIWGDYLSREYSKYRANFSLNEQRHDTNKQFTIYEDLGTNVSRH